MVSIRFWILVALIAYLSVIIDRYMPAYSTSGFAQRGLCTAPSYQYNIKSMPVLSNSSLLATNLILYDGDSSCIDTEHLNACLALRDNPVFQKSDETYSHMLKIGNYAFIDETDMLLFYFCILIIVSLVPVTLLLMAMTYNTTYKLRNEDSWELVSILIAPYFFRVCNHAGIISEGSCAYAVESLQDVVGFCDPLEACGLRIVSILNISKHEAMFLTYEHVMHIMGIVWIVNESINLLLLLIYVCYSVPRVEALAYRQRVQNMHGEELQRALEAGSDEFIDLYLSDWKHIYTLNYLRLQRRIHTEAATPVYSPLATLPPAAEAAERAGVYDVELVDDSNTCTLCSAALFPDPETGTQGEPGQGTYAADTCLHTPPTYTCVLTITCIPSLYPAEVRAKSVIQLPCSHAFHQVCILQCAMSPTNFRDECPACKADTYVLK